MKKISKKLDEFQEQNYIPYEQWSKIKHHCIISVGGESMLDIEGFIKTAHWNLQTNEFTYTVTKEPSEALLFDSEVSGILYHSLTRISGIKNHYHYPILIGSKFKKQKK